MKGIHRDSSPARASARLHWTLEINDRPSLRRINTAACATCRAIQLGLHYRSALLQPKEHFPVPDSHLSSLYFVLTFELAIRL
ncbi:hypothetical protein OUZ56_013234 [Daphnia magna]|uniref:Uncharacterized protein n=1 Tax=Daphnia magna TaxID=35525 RepID=A0ABQ9Z5A2_9CRUS|nr:hypothetical protein OUZ56_013234 [Daphnia magna]